MTLAMVAVAASLLAAAGAYLIYTSFAFGWPGQAPRMSAPRPSPWSVRRWMIQAGVGDVSPRELSAAMGAMFLIGATAAFVLFGAWFPALVAGLAVAAAPVSAYRSRRIQRMSAAAEAWPRMLEEIRLRTGSLGRSIPQALFESGRRAPEEWRPAFAAAEREWLLTTDFQRTAALLKLRLNDATVDAVCETLVIAHEVGGTDLDARLADLIEDRNLDLQGRKDAASRQAGVRFARRFVLLVPIGMALGGLTIGTGRQAYETPGGQVAVVIGLLSIAACWMWSGRLMRLPTEPRVFR